MPTTLPARTSTSPIVARATRPSLWRIVVGLMLVKLSRNAFRVGEQLCAAAERISRVGTKGGR